MTLANYIKDVRRKGRCYFTLNALMSDLELSKNAALNAIHRLKPYGDLITPSRGLYVIVPPEHQLLGSIPAEELVPILMDYLQTDYYVSLLSAAQYFGASHQKPFRFQVVSNKRFQHPLIFGDIAIEMVYKKSLTKLPVQNVTVDTGYLKMATPELVALDLFSYPHHSGGLNHIATVLSELIEAIHPKKLSQLAKIVGEKAWLQRFGFILEQIDTMDNKKKNQIINALQKLLDGNMKYYIPLAPEMPIAGCPYVKKWMIIANTDVESDL